MPSDVQPQSDCCKMLTYHIITGLQLRDQTVQQSLTVIRMDNLTV